MSAAEPWYRDGLRFACTRCGNCCTGSPGSVRVSEEETVELARLVGLDRATFLERCTRELEDGTRSLAERANHDCIFWSRAEGCTVYAARPRQCRTWPFWKKHLASPAHWQAAGRVCPGLGQGALHAAEAIASSAAADGTSGALSDPRCELG